MNTNVKHVHYVVVEGKEYAFQDRASAMVFKDEHTESHYYKRHFMETDHYGCGQYNSCVICNEFNDKQMKLAKVN